MSVMLERWNDDRMDALDAKIDDMGVRLARVEVRVDDGFKQADKRFEKVESVLLEQRREMKAGFQRIDDRFQKMDDRFQKIDDRFQKMDDRLMHLLVAVMGAGATIVAAIIVTPLA
jgi:hypothetical protein